MSARPPPRGSRESGAPKSTGRAVGSVAVSAILITITGCWVGGDIRYRDHPELANVTLASGERKVVGGARDTSAAGVHVHVGETPNDWVPQTEIGPVHGTRGGYRSCDELVADVLRDLLADAQAFRRDSRARGQVPDPVGLEWQETALQLGLLPALRATHRGAGDGSKVTQPSPALSRALPRSILAAR
jgi:hypothetical protein